MFKHMLVPLDGSRLAEAALPVASYLAQTLNAGVTLVHAIERGAPQEVHGERHLTAPDEALAYLDEVAARAFPPTVCRDRHVHADQVGDVARSIAEHAGELRPDLIVMCTHGRSGLRGWLFGSIAQQVISMGTTPVLLVHPSGDAAAPPPFACRRILVPRDFPVTHELGLSVAARLAKACSAAVHLLVVIPTSGTLSGERAVTRRLLPGATAAILEMSSEGAEESIAAAVARLQADGLAVTSEVCRGDPAETIVAVAGRIAADLVVLGTHGKHGMEAFWEGSVAPKVSSSARVPILLVPEKDSAPAG